MLKYFSKHISFLFYLIWVSANPMLAQDCPKVFNTHQNLEAELDDRVIDEHWQSYRFVPIGTDSILGKYVLSSRDGVLIEELILMSSGEFFHYSRTDDVQYIEDLYMRERGSYSIIEDTLSVLYERHSIDSTRYSAIAESGYDLQHRGTGDDLKQLNEYHNTWLFRSVGSFVFLVRPQEKERFIKESIREGGLPFVVAFERNNYMTNYLLRVEDAPGCNG